MRKLLVICGPTVTGKTQLGVRIAKKFSGELVSADSRQVYRGMDIATGKDLPVNSKFQITNPKLGLGYYLFDGIPVWMLDVVKPTDSFSVAQYHELVHKVIGGIWRQGKLPILVGGTGLYIKAIIDGIDTLGVPPNPALRAAYSQKQTSELFDILFHLAPETANSLNVADRNNKRRIIRKIEIAQMGIKEEVKRQWQDLDVLMVGLTAPFQILRTRIEKRIDEFLKQGAEDEVLKLLARGVTWENQGMNTLGYKQWRPYFEKKSTKEEVIEQWKRLEWQYARRQLTWFKKDQGICWFDITKRGWEEEVEEKVGEWYNKDKLKS